MQTESERRADLRKKYPKASSKRIQTTIDSDYAKGTIIADPIKITSKRTEPMFDFKKEGRVETAPDYSNVVYDPMFPHTVTPPEEPSTLMKTLFPATVMGKEGGGIGERGGYVINPAIDLITLLDRATGHALSGGTYPMSDPQTYPLKAITEKAIDVLPIDKSGIVAENLRFGAPFLSLGGIKQLGTKLGKSALKSSLDIGTKEAENLAKMFGKKTAKEGREAVTNLMVDENLYSPLGLGRMQAKAGKVKEGAETALDNKVRAVIPEITNELQRTISSIDNTIQNLTPDYIARTGIDEAGLRTIRDRLVRRAQDAATPNLDEVFSALKDDIANGRIPGIAPENIDKLVKDVDKLHNVYTQPTKTGINFIQPSTILDRRVSVDDIKKLRGTVSGDKNLITDPAKRLVVDRLEQTMLPAAPDILTDYQKIKQLGATGDVLKDAIEKAEKKPLLDIKDYLVGGLGMGVGSRVLPTAVGAATASPALTTLANSALAVPAAIAVKKALGGGRGAGALLEAANLPRYIPGIGPKLNQALNSQTLLDYLAAGGLKTVARAIEPREREARKKALERKLKEGN